MFRLFSHRIRSFSLIEMLVVMVLSSIMVSIIYFTYYTVTTYQTGLSNRYALFQDRSSLYFLLKKDFADSYSIRTGQLNELKIYTTEGDSPVYYFFDKEFVWRKQQFREDTFRCKITDIGFFFEDERVGTQNSRVEEADLLMEIGGDTLKLRLLKNYDRASLIETKYDTLP